MEGQIEVVVPCIALTNGAGRRHLRRVAAETDGVGGEVRLHGVGDEVHEMLLAARAGDVRVIFLRGWTEIDAGHGHSPFQSRSLHLYGNDGGDVLSWGHKMKGGMYHESSTSLR